MYNSDLYEVDLQNQEECDAKIKDGAILYRIASLTHWQKDHIISGEGTRYTKSAGRFHNIQQPASYCANNVIVCLAELLYFMYRKTLKSIEDGQEPKHITMCTKEQRKFVVFSVKQIDDLIFIDSIGARRYDPRIVSSTIVFPDSNYKPLWAFSDKLRFESKNGVVYPSARHSVDLAFAFFRNETDKINDSIYESLLLKLSLISESQNLSICPPDDFRPITSKLHSTMGYYQFENIDLFNDLNMKGLIHPKDIPASGYIDFVRRRYKSYPRNAYLP